MNLAALRENLSRADMPEMYARQATSEGENQKVIWRAAAMPYIIALSVPAGADELMKPEMGSI
jgi:hypothetical protein